MTTRYQPNYLPGAIFGMFHETGHALYEQGVDPALTRSALATDFLGLYAVGGASYGTHESQIRLWENQSAAAAPSGSCTFAPAAFFPEQLAGVDRGAVLSRRQPCAAQPDPCRGRRGHL